MSNRRIIATFVPRAWINDYAIEIDGRVGFDVTDEILAMPKEERELLRDDDYESDDLVPLEIMDSHNGPFRVEIESAVLAYFADTAESQEPSI